jgi:broad specificity phosphatase PhoE
MLGADLLGGDRRKDCEITMRYVLLCRHGPHRMGTLMPVKVNGEDVYPSDAIGDRLREQLEAAPTADKALSLKSIWCADSAEAKATLRRILEALGLTLDGNRASDMANPEAAVSISFKEELTPPNSLRKDAEGIQATDRLISGLRDGLPGEPGTVLVVGHQPQLSWIADGLLRVRWAARLLASPPVPIDRAGLVCVTLDGASRRRAKLAWAISFDDKDAARQVREKIQRKMDTAKQLAGALTLGLTVIFGVLFSKEQFGSLGERRWAVQAAAALLLVAALLYFAAMYAYDRLLMPERFWGERKPKVRRFRRRRRWLVDRPPSSAAWILYQNMMRVWRNLFTSASLLAGAGIVLLGYAALRLRPWQALEVGIPALVAVALWVRWSRPVLGSED